MAFKFVAAGQCGAAAALRWRGQFRQRQNFEMVQVFGKTL